MRHTRLVAYLFAAPVALFSAGSARAATIANGSFETGDFTGWTTQSGPTDIWKADAQRSRSAAATA